MQIYGSPEKAKSLAIIVEDPDAGDDTWVHWVVRNIPVSNRITEDCVPENEGINDFGNRHYGGPCSPLGMHHYSFNFFALDMALQLKSTITKSDLENAMASHVLASGELIGVYSRS